jgi:hypothetical protein
MSTNNITGKTIISRPPSKASDEGYDAIFGKSKELVEAAEEHGIGHTFLVTDKIAVSADVGKDHADVGFEVKF